MNNYCNIDIIRSSVSGIPPFFTRTPCKTKNPLQKNALNKIVKKFSTAGLDSSYTTIAQSLGTQDQLIENLNR